MINVGDKIKVKLISDKNYYENLFLIISYNTNKDDLLFNVVEISTGLCPWSPFKSLQDLNDKIDKYFEIIKVNS